MVFVVAKLHVQLMHWEEPAVIEETIAQCDALFTQIPASLVHTYALYKFNIISLI